MSRLSSTEAFPATHCPLGMRRAARQSTLVVELPFPDGRPGQEGLPEMFARLSTYQGSPLPAEGDLAANSQAIVEQIRDAPGFRGAYYLVDRASGKAKSLTLWDDEETMLASEDRATRLRAESAHREGQRIITVERYEVGYSYLHP
ncbi:hypothetical protein [Streptomyces sp. NPDC059072]|uniref:hypothetical protein n=1 Tax=unclassified Streptomyces TaxID=2593676 RepID=UPI003692B573